jgi:hypothetical protein
MPDRLSEIRARLDAYERDGCMAEVGDHFTVFDITWLLDEVESEQAHAQTLIERIDQLHLEITRLRFGKPFPDPAHEITMTHRGSVPGYSGPAPAGPPPPARPPVGVEVVNPFTGERILREADDA